MDGITFLKQLNHGAPVGGAYYFCGEDGYSLQKGVAALTERTNPDLREMNTQTLRSPAAADVSAAAETLPFFDALRIVVVTEFDVDTANALADYAKTMPETTALVFVRPGKAPAGNALYKTISEQGRAVSFDPLTEPQTEAFLNKRAKENGLTLRPEAARLLIAFLGVDLAALENALLLLGGYVGYDAAIDEGAVRACVTPSSEYQVFRILDQLWAGNRREGIASLAGLVNSPSESAIGLATLFERNVRTVVNAKQLLQNGRRESEFAALLGVKPFVAQKAARNAKKRTLEQLNRMLTAFCEVEWRQKQGIAKAEDALLAACYENFA